MADQDQHPRPPFHPVINPPLPLPPGRGGTPGSKDLEPNKLPRLLVLPKDDFLERVPEVDNETRESEYEFNHNDHENEYVNVNTNTNENENENEKSSDIFLDHYEREESRGRRRSHRDCFPKCCAWTCMIVSLLLLLLFIVGLAMFSFLKSKMPESHVIDLRFSKMEIKPDRSKKLLLNMDVKAVIELSNDNDGSVLHYSPLVAHVSSENVNLGVVNFPKFVQRPGSVQSLNVKTTVRKKEIYEVDAAILKADYKYYQMVLDVRIIGKIGVEFVGMKLELPVVIACEGVKQTEMNRGFKHKCNIETFTKG